MDHYLRSLPVSLQKRVSKGDPNLADNFVELVEWYFPAQSLVTTPTATWTFHPKPPSPLAAGKTVPGEVGGKHRKDTWGGFLVFEDWHPKQGKPGPVNQPNWIHV